MAAAQLEALLLQSAKVNVSIRRQLGRLRRDPRTKYYTYVLLLQDNKMYVGNTNNIYNRLVDHCLMGENSSVWVRRHGPVKRVVEIARDCDLEDEHYKTMEYMDLFGWQNVRGAAYCRPTMRQPPAPLKTFAKNPAKRMQYLTRAEIDDVVQVVRDLADRQTAISDDTGSGSATPSPSASPPPPAAGDGSSASSCVTPAPDAPAPDAPAA
jgi:hypothetical protein